MKQLTANVFVETELRGSNHGIVTTSDGIVMIDTPHKSSVKDPGERWRRFLERVGTRSNDFACRLSRARFVYLHRRETATHWLPL